MVAPHAKQWLNGCVGYEIYTRSFADSSRDGFGDLNGIRERLDYLAWLGIDLVWLTPIYPSPDHDHGYDVADYTSVRDAHGTVADVEALVERAHSLGMKLILDIVPNHTSWDHEWFKAAIADPSSPERDMYLFRDPAPDGGPPNNWISHFGGSAWTLDEASGQYWCHLFVKEQPDLNWRNERVLEEFDNIYRFWFERGVDGFRIDVAHGLLKHESFADIPQRETPGPDAGPLETFFSYDHIYDMDQDDNVEIFQRWQRVAAEYDATLLAESGVNDHHRLARYVGPGALDLTFFLKPGGMRWRPEALLREHLDLAEVEPHGVSWVISNHDQPRPVSRYIEDLPGDAGDPARLERGQRRSLAMTTLHMALGGVPFLYYGEELGLPNGAVDPERREDPVATRNDSDGGEGRDVARTPMSWDDSPYNGFSTTDPWIATEDRPPEHTVEFQRNDPSAPVHRYRDLLAVRKANPDIHEAVFERLDAPNDSVAVIRRGSTLTVVNLGEDAVAVSLDGAMAGAWKIAFSSADDGASLAGADLQVEGETGLILINDA